MTAHYGERSGVLLTAEKGEDVYEDMKTRDRYAEFMDIPVVSVVGNDPDALAGLVNWCIIGNNPLGAFVGHTDKLAVYHSTESGNSVAGWEIHQPYPGQQIVMNHPYVRSDQTERGANESQQRYYNFLTWTYTLDGWVPDFGPNPVVRGILNQSSDVQDLVNLRPGILNETRVLYLVSNNPTGDFTNHANDFAFRDRGTGEWRFVKGKVGQRVTFLDIWDMQDDYELKKIYSGPTSYQTFWQQTNSIQMTTRVDRTGDVLTLSRSGNQVVKIVADADITVNLDYDLSMMNDQMLETTIMINPGLFNVTWKRNGNKQVIWENNATPTLKINQWNFIKVKVVRYVDSGAFDDHYYAKIDSSGYPFNPYQGWVLDEDTDVFVDENTVTDAINDLITDNSYNPLSTKVAILPQPPEAGSRITVMVTHSSDNRMLTSEDDGLTWVDKGLISGDWGGGIADLYRNSGLDCIRTFGYDMDPTQPDYLISSNYYDAIARLNSSTASAEKVQDSSNGTYIEPCYNVGYFQVNYGLTWRPIVKSGSWNGQITVGSQGLSDWFYTENNNNNIGESYNVGVFFNDHCISGPFSEYGNIVISFGGTYSGPNQDDIMFGFMNTSDFSVRQFNSPPEFVGQDHYYIQATRCYNINNKLMMLRYSPDSYLYVSASFGQEWVKIDLRHTDTNYTPFIWYDNFNDVILAIYERYDGTMDAIKWSSDGYNFNYIQLPTLGVDEQYSRLVATTRAGILLTVTDIYGVFKRVLTLKRSA